AGAYTAGGDALGFHTYSAELLARAGGDKPTQLDYSIVYSYDRWYPTFTLAGFGYSDDADITIVRDAERTTYRERTDRALAQMTIPYRRVRWQTYATGGVVRDHIESDLPFDIAPSSLARAGIFTGTLQGIRAGVTFNNATEFGFSISPENGITTIVEAENLSRALGSDASLRQYRGELRGYRAIPFARAPLGRHVIAARVAAGTTSGDFVLQRELKVGGIAEGEFAMLDTTRFSVRGYPGGVLRGDSAAIASIEYRFPIWQIDRGPGAWPIFFNRILGDVFYDTGSAWNRRAVTLPALTRPRSSATDRRISSAGVELGFDVVLGFFSPLRYRIGAAYPFDDRGNGVNFYAAFGSSF
ncbi:MAG TPA: BamA/TamA family outer membrane protein, partial [Thermoanaerobaculia bacterium]|nr:BamA/TamA family outer membrane protein [Thermoanaerobaculia bacterium]